MGVSCVGNFRPDALSGSAAKYSANLVAAKTRPALLVFVRIMYHRVSVLSTKSRSDYTIPSNRCGLFVLI